jgi:hypothetical protein
LLKRTRLLQISNFAFAVLKKRRKLQGFLWKERLSRYTPFFPLRHPERSAAKRAKSNGSRNGFFL